MWSINNRIRWCQVTKKCELSRSLAYNYKSHNLLSVFSVEFNSQYSQCRGITTMDQCVFYWIWLTVQMHLWTSVFSTHSAEASLLWTSVFFCWILLTVQRHHYSGPVCFLLNLTYSAETSLLWTRTFLGEFDLQCRSITILDHINTT